MENQNPDFELQEGYNILTVNHLYLKRLVHKDLNIIFNEMTLVGSVQDSAVFNDPIKDLSFLEQLTNVFWM